MNPSLLYLFAAFAVVWLFLFGYLMYISNRIGALQQQVDLLLEERAAEGRTGQAAAAPKAVAEQP